jgi:PAS domain S-box-containing protein
MRWWPRSIRWQMLLGLVLLEVLSIALFAILLLRLEGFEIRSRVFDRVSHQANSLAAQAHEAYEQNRLEWVGLSVKIMGQAPSVFRARITDSEGKTLFVGAGDPANFPLVPEELTQIKQVNGTAPRVFSFGRNRWEGICAIYAGSTVRGYALVESRPSWDTEQTSDMLHGILLFGAVWIVASMVLVGLIARAISKPLAILHKGTQALISLPESSDAFPLPVPVNNEFGELIGAFNSMVASIQEQRSGLSDTLSILDSMLANAPVGLAFFDRHLRFVRVNQEFANLTEIPLSRHLGRAASELMPASVAEPLDEALDGVFENEGSVREVELSGHTPVSNQPWTWLVSVYPIRTAAQQVRWAGIIVRDVSERARSEEALRRTEKLAATGRLAASIAHEINNPLEAITNLLFLLRNFSGLGEPALEYVTMAEHEARRITEIAQQTLRFYRQSTLPLRVDVGEIIDSVLDLYRGRLNNLNINVERQFSSDASLFCFEGEIRQVIANLIGNAMDAISSGGRLIVRARPSRQWSDGGAPGVRLTVADTGSGMPAEVRSRIFEAFYTTKEATGTGLGLWVSHEIILKHHGQVRVRSRFGSADHPSGTVFQIFLPDDEKLTNVPARAAVALKATP